MTRARGSWVPGATLPSGERAVPKLLGQAQPFLHPATKAGGRENIWAGQKGCEIKVKPVIKLPDAGVLPDLSCTGPGTVTGCFGSAAAPPGGSGEVAALPSLWTAQQPQPQPAAPGASLNASGAGSRLVEEVPKCWQGQSGQPVPARRS